MIQIDMNIPKTCYDCPFHIYHSGENYVCVATPLFYPMNLANYKDGRKDFCPLIEVAQKPILDKIFCMVHPLSIMSTPELEHKAIMQIAEMLEPLCLPGGEEEE